MCRQNVSRKMIGYTPFTRRANLFKHLYSLDFMHSYSKYLNTKKKAHRKMLPQRVLPLFFVYVLLFLVRDGFGQFPSVCNTPENLQNKRCCPNDCGSTSGRGSCLNVTSEAMTQANNSNATILAVLRDSASKTYKGTIDSRYLWPTMVFQNVCICNDNYYGPDCSDCNFGWTGATCSEKAPKVTRKDFRQLTNDEKNAFFHGLTMLKTETAPLYWSVITEEPADDSGRVTLVDVTTYDYLVYIHHYVSRDASHACRKLNTEPDVRDLECLNVDFAHSGPNFPVWHRTYMLILERAMQRVLGNSNFGFPYWSWESNYNILTAESDQLGSAVTNDGGVQISGQKDRRDISGGILNNWSTVCDLTYTTTIGSLTSKGDAYWNSLCKKEMLSYYQKEERYKMLCEQFWKPCNPNNDRANNNKLQRGKEESYLPGLREVQMTIAAPDYDAPNPDYIGDKDENNKDILIYEQKSERKSFRSRLEGWSFLCSGSNSFCIAPQIHGTYQRMHNIIHDWIDGHMSVPPSAVNDPVFSLHHCNIDRILESWMKRFYSKKKSLPHYKISGGHIGHNRDDYMVPFFPLITPGQQYSRASDWGYEYDTYINDDIKDSDIKKCSDQIGDSVDRNYCPDSKGYPQAEGNCSICTASSECKYFIYTNPARNPYIGDCPASQCLGDPPTKPTNCKRDGSGCITNGSGATKPKFNLILLATALLFTITGFFHF